MQLELKNNIDVSLSWDSEGFGIQVGTFEDTVIHEEEQFTIQFDLYVEHTVKHDNGDYYNPPSCEDLGKDEEVTSIVVYDLEENIVDLSEEELDKLRLEILDKLNYD